MQFGFEGAVANSIDGRQRLVDDRKGALEIAGPGFGLGQGDLDEPVENQAFCSRRLSAPRRMPSRPSASAPLSAVAQPPKNSPKARNKRRSCSRTIRASSAALVSAREWSPRINLKRRRMHCFESERVGMREARDPRLHALDERNRAIDLAKRPRGERQIGHRGDARVHARSETPDRRRGRVGSRASARSR